jgi:hypothetical protein
MIHRGKLERAKLILDTARKFTCPNCTTDSKIGLLINAVEKLIEALQWQDEPKDNHLTKGVRHGKKKQ